MKTLFEYTYQGQWVKVCELPEGNPRDTLGRFQAETFSSLSPLRGISCYGDDIPALCVKAEHYIERISE